MQSSRPTTVKEHVLLYIRKHGPSAPKSIIAYYPHLNGDTVRWTMSKDMIPELLYRLKLGVYALTPVGEKAADEIFNQITLQGKQDKKGLVAQTSKELDPYSALEDVGELIERHTLPMIERAIAIYKKIHSRERK